MSLVNNNTRKIALILGVANSRSIAWSCVESFLRKDYDCIVTYRNDSDDNNNDKIGNKINKLVESIQYSSANDQTSTTTTRSAATLVAAIDDNDISNIPTTNNTAFQSNKGSRVLGCIPCNVETDIPSLFLNHIPNLLKNDPSTTESRKLDAIVHSIAYADMKGIGTLNDSIDDNQQQQQKQQKQQQQQQQQQQLVDGINSRRLHLSDATWTSYKESQHISSYSFLETAHYAIETDILSSLPSLTALTYIGSTRAVPNYHLMGPAKAALEAIVRGLALDLGSMSGYDDMSRFSRSVRVNAVSAGPLKTAAARGIPGFTNLYQHAAKHSPLKRNVTTKEVAEAVTWIASPLASGITGQILYVDGGYSSIVPCDV